MMEYIYIYLFCLHVCIQLQYVHYHSHILYDIKGNKLHKSACVYCCMLGSGIRSASATNSTPVGYKYVMSIVRIIHR